LTEFPDDKETGPVLSSPSITSATVEGKQNRAKLLRAWVEISAWLTDYTKRFGELLLVSWKNSRDADISQLKP
jgi:hypothetical protein